MLAVNFHGHKYHACTDERHENLSDNQMGVDEDDVLFRQDITATIRTGLDLSLALLVHVGISKMQD